MHKKLEAELTSLAHSILQMKNRDDVFALQKKAHEVYEKLSVLAYVEEYINNTPNPEHTKEELIAMVEEAEEKRTEPVVEAVAVVEKEEVVEKDEETEVSADEVIDNTIEEVKEPEVNADSSEEEEVIKYELEDSSESEEETPAEEFQEVSETSEEVEEVESEEEEKETVELELEMTVEEPEDLFTVEEKKAPSLEEELQDTMPLDEVANLFENVPKKSLNDKLQGDIQIGLNDRIAFVKHLFEGSQEDFNRVVSQLNTFKTEKEAKKFLNKMVKPDYDWTEKEEFEDRFMAIVERKFV